MDVHVLLLDIEGTVCPISFVKDVLFPYALQVLPTTLATEWDSPALQPYLSAFPAEHRSSPSALLAHVQSLMAQDLKIPYLKALQGYLWTQGYLNGSLKCPLFPDVAPVLRAFHRAALPIVIYSSGSVPAQQLLFQHTTDGDLRPLLSGYFDTVNAGPKTDSASYRKIAGTRQEDIAKWLFLSDNVNEVRAAKEAGMQACVVVREGNSPLSPEDREGQLVISSFDELRIAGVQN